VSRSPSGLAEGRPVHVKICGVTSVADAEVCLAAGASSIGLNFVPESPRCVSEDVARAIVVAVGERALVGGVVADLEVEAMLALRARVGLGCLQLHGDEPPGHLAPLLPHAYKAIRVAGAEDVARARAYGGEYLLVDAWVPGVRGGTGKTLDLSLVLPLATERKLSLAGGLRPDNVADAVRAVRPFCVDVASGVESAPGKKDPAKIRAFIDAARSA
jgi:phosphoribosylanthranilate isomerase